MPLSIAPRPALFRIGQLSACQLEPRDIPALQAFLVANPDYFLSVHGEPPRADEAQQEFDDRPPQGMTFEAMYMIGFVGSNGDLVGVASLLSDFLAQGVWHIGLFIMATSLHGTGVSAALYEGLQDWMRAKGALWIRLGVVLGSRRAERFWEKLGYTEVRRRHGVHMGMRVNTIRVLMKPLAGRELTEYLEWVERDRPDSSLA